MPSTRQIHPNRHTTTGQDPTSGSGIGAGPGAAPGGAGRSPRAPRRASAAGGPEPCQRHGEDRVPGRGHGRRGRQHRGHGTAPQRGGRGTVRRGPGPVHARELPAGVGLGERPPTRQGQPAVPHRPGPAGTAAAGGGDGGVPRCRFQPASGVRPRQAGRRVRPHEDRGKVVAGPGPERAGRHPVDPAGRTCDRGHPAPRRAPGSAAGTPGPPGARRRSSPRPSPPPGTPAPPAP